MKDDPPSYSRWNPKPTWLRVYHHPPKKGYTYQVKKTETGTPFQAYLSHQGVWLYENKDGLPVSDHLFLYYLTSPDMKDEVFYKIKSASGNFSTGGAEPGWSKNGKVWTKRGHLSSHFTNLSTRGRQIYRDAQAEVVTIEVKILTREPCTNFIDEALDRQAVRENQEREYVARLQRERDLRELARLQRQYPNV